MIVSIGAAQAEVLRHPPAPVFQHDVQRGAERVAVVGMQHRQPVARRAAQAVGRQAELLGNVWPCHDAVAQHVPIPHSVAGAGHRQRLPLQVGEQALIERAAGEGMLDDGEADQ